MSCNSCAEPFSLLRSEKGCPNCGFSYCSKCLNYKIFLPKLNSSRKVCKKCKNATHLTENIEPPAAYFKSIKGVKTNNMNNKGNYIELEIQERLQKLKADKLEEKDPIKESNEDIAARLKKLRDVPTTSQTEIEQRLASIKGVPITAVQSKPILPALDLRSEEEQINDLMKQYIEQSNINKKYNNEFDTKINDIEKRLQKLKGSNSTSTSQNNIYHVNDEESEDEIINNTIEKAKVEMSHDDIGTPTSGELPFCEICNEDAIMRCLGCKYLFCKRCFIEHRDEDDGCDRYEEYTAPK